MKRRQPAYSITWFTPLTAFAFRGVSSACSDTREAEATTTKRFYTENAFSINSCLPLCVVLPAVTHTYTHSTASKEYPGTSQEFHAYPGSLLLQTSTLKQAKAGETQLRPSLA